MIRRTLRTLDRADKDFDDAIDYYLMHAGEPIAERFVNAISTAYAMIGDNPEIGALRLGDAIGRPALRTWTVRGFPYVICYEVGPDSVDVWRVLHARSDIPEHLFKTGD